MQGAIFGSYSLTEFIDLYCLNIRNNHHYSIFLEVDQYSIVGLKQGKIDNINKKNQSNYLIGILCDDIENSVLEKNLIEYFETSSKRDINYLIDTKKEFIYFCYEESKVTFMSTKDMHMHVSEFNSFSTTPVNGFTQVKSNMVYTIPVFKDNKFNSDLNKLVV